MKMVFLKLLQNSLENTCVEISFFDQVSGRSSATLFKKRFEHGCFPVNFEKLLRRLVLLIICEQLFS